MSNGNEESSDITIIVMDGDKVVNVKKIDKVEIGKAIEMGAICVTTKEKEPSKVMEGIKSVGEGVSDTGKAAIIGVQRGAGFLGRIVSGIKTGIHEAACEYDQQKLAKMETKVAEEKVEERGHCE